MDVLQHCHHILSVDGAQVGFLNEACQVVLSGLLQCLGWHTPGSAGHEPPALGQFCHTRQAKDCLWTGCLVLLWYLHILWRAIIPWQNLWGLLSPLYNFLWRVFPPVVTPRMAHLSSGCQKSNLCCHPCQLPHRQGAGWPPHGLQPHQLPPFSLILWERVVSFSEAALVDSPTPAHSGHHFSSGHLQWSSDQSEFMAGFFEVVCDFYSNWLVCLKIYNLW